MSFVIKSLWFIPNKCFNTIVSKSGGLNSFEKGVICKHKYANQPYQAISKFVNYTCVRMLYFMSRSTRTGTLISVGSDILLGMICD